MKITMEKVLFWIFSGLVLLLPIFFIPSLPVPILFVKYTLLVVAVVSAVVIWILLRLKDGTCLFPINMLSLSGVAVLAVMLISSLISVSPWNSLIGQIPQTDTFLFYLLVFVLMFLVPSVFNTTERIFNTYKVFFVTLGILAIFHIARLVFGANFLSFGYFPNITDNVLGKWNELGIFFGLGSVISLVSLELLTLSKNWKIILYSILSVSVLLLAVINFSSVWYVLGILALVFFVYSIVIARSGSAKKNTSVALPITSFVIFLISIAFVFGGTFVNSFTAKYFNVYQNEFILPLQVTSNIAKGTISNGPVLTKIFGAGPNRFVNEWSKYKPVEVNNSVFWNTDFNYGFGIVPSTLVTTGPLGLISWIAFLGILIYMGFRSILSRITDPFQRYVVTSSFLSALYLWLFNVIYVPSLVIIVLTFLFTGIFISALHTAGILKDFRFEYFKNPKIGFVSVLVLILILIGGLGLVYTVISKFVGNFNYNQGVIAVNNNNIDEGERKIISAIGFDKNDLYARALARVYMLRLGVLLNSSATSTSPETVKSQFSNYSNTALAASNFAINLDNTNYQNWLALGDVWGSLVPLKIEKSYEGSLSGYQNALKYNPKNPYIYLQIAKLEYAQGNKKAAKENVVTAIGLKGDYVDAYAFLAELQIAEGDINSAINSLTSASAYAPQNSNIKYLLGLSYYQIGKVNEAIAQFTELQKLNPDNKDIENILANLKNGKAPFYKAEKVAPAPAKKKVVK